MPSTLDFTHFPGNIINNEIVPTAATRHGIDPSTGEPLWEVPVATKDDLENAVKHAREAFVTWSETTFQRRAEMLLRYADAIEANREGLQKLLTMEQGKPLSLSKVTLLLPLVSFSPQKQNSAFLILQQKSRVMGKGEGIRKRGHFTYPQLLLTLISFSKQRPKSTCP
jgi:hypothetical protein